jgi:1,4-alpha-glucan branching enzyme
VQRNTDGSDMYIPMSTSVLEVRLSQPPKEPKYVPTPEPQTWALGTSFSISADANKSSAVKLYHNGTVIAASAGNVTTLSGNSTVTVAGNQQIVAEAMDGTTTKYDTINIFVAPTVNVAPLPAGVKEGINYDANNTSVTLVLNAPQKSRVAVIGEFPGSGWSEQAQNIMNKTADGKYWWLRINNLTPGTEYAYQYLVDGNLKIADPYTEKILDPGPFADAQISAATYPGLKAYPTGLTTGIVSVLQTAAPTYNWGVTSFSHPDKRGLVIYELLVRDFVAAHDWKTLRDTLSYLKRLGINAIEIMPWTEFEGNNSWGYNTYQYFAPDKYYGPKNTLKEFIDTCHKNGIAVIMDVVLNHTYGPSPLAQLYWDPANNRPAANNPWYNAVQPHAFGFGEDFNHESADTKYFFNRVLQHWIKEYKVDGYRIDFSKGLTQKPSSNDAAFSAFDAGRIAIITGYADTIRAADPNSYIILEHFADNAEEKELADNKGLLLWANVWTQYQEASMGYVSNSNLDGGVHTSRGWANPHLVTFMESHDEERVTYKNIKYGNTAGSYTIKDTATALKRMQLNAVFLLTIPGPKMIWQFGELGYDYSRCYLSTNGEGGDCDKKTDAKPIRWDYATEARRKQVYDTYSQLNKLRFHQWYKGVFQSSAIEKNLAGAFKWIKLTTANDTSDVVVIGNFEVTPQTGTVIFPTAGTWYDYFGNFIHTATGAAQSFTLQPGEFHVYVNRNVNNLTATPVTNVPWNGATLEAKVFPNPVTANYTAEIKLPQSGTTKIDLYNNVGQYITTVYNGFLTSGTKTIPLPALSWQKGMYFLKLQSKDKTKTISLSVQ